MEFNVTTVGKIYHSKSDIQNLKSIGFEFNETGSGFFLIVDNPQIIEFNSVQEIVDFSIKFGQIIIDGNTIEIYDDYKES